MLHGLIYAPVCHRIAARVLNLGPAARRCWVAAVRRVVLAVSSPVFFSRKKEAQKSNGRGGADCCMVRPPRTKIRAQGTLAPPPPPFLAAAHVSQVSLPALSPGRVRPGCHRGSGSPQSGGGSAPSERPRALLALVACWWLCMCVMFLLVVLGDMTRMLLRCCCALPRAVILQFQFGTRGSRGRFRKLPARGETGNSPDPRVWIRLATLATLGATLCFPGNTLGRPCNDPAATLEHPPEAGAI